MLIVPLQDEHVEAVARLHREALGGLLSRLGPGVLLAHHRNAAAGGAQRAFVAIEAGAVVGFIAGSARPDAVRSDAFARGPLRMLFALVGAVVSAPVAFAALLRSQLRHGRSAFDEQAAELTYLAVDARFRARGIAAQLLERFEKALSADGADYFELSVESDNAPAIAFYEARGFRIVGRYSEFGRPYLRYARGVSAEPEGTSSLRGDTRRDGRLAGRFLRYCIAGLFATLVYFVALVAAVEGLGWQPVPSAVAATVVVICTSYVVNRIWIFDTDLAHAAAFARFVVASLAGIAINAALMWVAVERLHWPYLAGALLATVVMPPLNFAINYLWAFRMDAGGRAGP